MQSRRDVILALCGVATVAGCTEMADTESGPTANNMTSQGDKSADNTTSQDAESPDGNQEQCATTVTIESGGMAPNLSRGETVCIKELDSYQPVKSPDETGVITAEVGEEIGYTTLGGTGDVIRHYPDGDRDGTPVIARAVSWDGNAYVTKGDANPEPYPWTAPPNAVIGLVTGTVEETT